MFVAVAQMHRAQGQLRRGRGQYRKALDLDPKYLAALVGYARLEDRRSNFEAATKLLPARDQEASQERLGAQRPGPLLPPPRHAARSHQGAETRRRAEGDSKLYRNNLAAVYVEQGKNSEALAQLTAAHGKAVAHYNLGYLLMQKEPARAGDDRLPEGGRSRSAARAAQEWIARLAGPPMHGGATGGRADLDRRAAQMASTIESVPSVTPPASRRPGIAAQPTSSFRFVSSASAVDRAGRDDSRHGQSRGRAIARVRRPSRRR